MKPHLPYSPSRDTYTLDDADANLGHEHKKEQHEVEGTVTPRGKREREVQQIFKHACN